MSELQTQQGWPFLTQEFVFSHLVISESNQEDGRGCEKTRTQLVKAPSISVFWDSPSLLGQGEEVTRTPPGRKQTHALPPWWDVVPRQSPASGGTTPSVADSEGSSTGITQAMAGASPVK